MLELVRFQKTELPMAAGGEDMVLSASDILLSERPEKDCARDRELAKYADCMRASVSLQIKKRTCFNTHIWGL